MASAEERSDERWEKMWKQGLKPGDFFDAKTSAPALKLLHTEGKLPTGRYVSCQ
jgi:hypothetical protein